MNHLELTSSSWTDYSDYSDYADVIDYSDYANDSVLAYWFQTHEPDVPQVNTFFAVHISNARSAPYK